MKLWKLIAVIVPTVLVFSGCGGDNAKEKVELASTQASVPTVSETKKPDDRKSTTTAETLGELEIIGEGTKRIDNFEITLNNGIIQSALTQTDGTKLKAKQGQILKIKAKIKGIKSQNNELHEFTVYEPNETKMGANYIGFRAGEIDEKLVGNIYLERYDQNEEHEGFLYLDVPKRDQYRIKYKSSSDENVYWDIKITK